MFRMIQIEGGASRRQARSFRGGGKFKKSFTACPVLEYIVLLISISLFSAFDLSAQSITWQKADGPYISIKSLPDNVSINFLAVGPGDILFTATPYSSLMPSSGKLYRSTDRGVDWFPADSGLYMDSVRSITFAPSGKYYLCLGTFTSSTYLFVSTNAGNSWQTFFTFIGARAFAVDSSGTVYIGGSGGIYKSADPNLNFGDWERTGMGMITVNCLAALSEFKMVSGTRNGVLFSPDSAHTWLSTNVSDINVNNLILLSNGHLFASSSDSGVFRSIDSGKTWTGVDAGLPRKNIGGFSSGPEGYLYATISGEGIYRSTDEGDSWYSINGNLTSLFANAVTVTSDSTIFVGTSGGLFNSTDGGTTWGRSAQGFSTQNSSINAIAVADSQIFAGGSGGIYSSTDDGTTWKQVGLPDTTVLSILPEKSGEILAGTEDCGIQASTDGGQSWYFVGIADSSVFSFAIDSSGHTYAAAQRGIFRWTGSGTGWDKIWPPIANVYAIVVAPNGFMFAANDSDGIVRSTDGGASWPPLNLSYVWTYPESRALLLLPNGDILAGIGDHMHGKGIAIVHQGTDTLAMTSLDSGVVTSMAMNQDGIIFAGTSDNAVYRSTDNGYTWQSVALPDSVDNCLTVDNKGYVYAGTPDGLFISSETTLKVADRPPSVPSEIRLEQNYPNPFNPSTAISYRLSAVSHVTLKVYDVLGREVATLVDGIETPGNHQVMFDGSRFASGVYFYRLVAVTGDGVSSSIRKMIFLK